MGAPVQANSVVSTLLDRAHGGSGAVVVPGATDEVSLQFHAPPAAGVEFALSALGKALSETDGTTHWVFLVGGPGNGKSYELARFLREHGLAMESDEGGLARRQQAFEFSEKTLYVVNDATIQGRGAHDERGPLATEIVDCATSDPAHHAVFSVNRGILVEELARLPRPEGEDLIAHDVISWLHTEVVKGANGARIEAGQAAEGGYYRSATLSGTFVHVHAVFLDQLSLLEPRPEASDGTLGRYRPLEFDDEERIHVPAGQLIEELVDAAHWEDAECAACHASELCPFLANARDLRSETFRLGALRVLRAAEVRGGRLFTFRDLWSVCAGLVVGQQRANVSFAPPSGHPCTYVQAKVLGRAGQSNEQVLWDLSRHRIFEGFWPSTAPTFMGIRESEELDPPSGLEGPAADALALVDPVLDATRSSFQPVFDRLEATRYERLPHEAIADPGARAMDNGYSQLDRDTERALIAPVFVEGGEKIGDIPRRELMQWRGHSLIRYYGLWQGVPAERAVVSAWVDLRRELKDEPKPFPPMAALFGPLQTLLAPPAPYPEGQLQSFCLLPLFEPRVEPLAAKPDAGVWCVALRQNTLVWDAYADGDQVWVRLMREHEEAARFPLDFDLCREAMAYECLGSSHGFTTPGFTEIGRRVSPRLERIRASLLAATPIEGGTPIIYASNHAEFIRFDGARGQS